MLLRGFVRDKPHESQPWSPQSAKRTDLDRFAHDSDANHEEYRGVRRDGGEPTRRGVLMC